MKKARTILITIWIIFSGVLIYFGGEDFRDFGIIMSIVVLIVLWRALSDLINQSENLRHNRICYIKALYENITHEFLEPDDDYVINTARNYLENEGWIINLSPIFYEDEVYWEWQLTVHDYSSEDFISNRLSSGVYGDGFEYNKLSRDKALIDSLVFSLERYYLDSKINNEVFKLFDKANIKFSSLFHLIEYVQNNFPSEIIKVTGSSSLHVMSDARCGFKNWITELTNNLINISKEKYGN